MKNVYVFILIIFCCLSAVNKTMAQSGTTGTCDWALSGTSPNYTLTIKPTNGVTGAMADYTTSSLPTWSAYKDDIETLDIKQGVTYIGKTAFFEFERITSVTIPNSVTTIGDYAFGQCYDLTSITIPNSVTTIGSDAFTTCYSLASVTIPNSVTTIGGGAFCLSGLVSITIPNSVTTIESAVFWACVDLTSVTIPNSITTIEDGAFQSCTGLTEITIPNSVTYIGAHAFSYCTGLTEITIPNSVIELHAFLDCTGLTEMYVKAVNPPIIHNEAFLNVPTNIPVHVPCGSKTAYQNDNEWSYFTNIIGDVLFSISLQSNNANMGSVNVIQANNCTNNTAIIKATPNNCYSFMNWSDGNTQNPRTMQITSDTSVTAIFASTVVPINDTTVCSGTSATLTASSSASGSTYKWYSSQAASSPFHTGANYTTSNLTADTTFYISVLANGCETASGDRKEVKVSVKSVPVVSAVRTEICPGLTTRIFPNKDGSWTSSDSNIVDILNSGAIVGQSAGTASLTFYDSTTACSASMNITVKAYPNPDEITGKKVVCIGQDIELSNSMSGGVWTKNNSNISIISQTATPAKATVRGVTKGNSYVTYTVSNGECKTKRTFQLKIIPVPTTPPKIIIGVER